MIRLLVLAGALMAVAFALDSTATSACKPRFASWVAKFNRQYKNAAEYASREAIFCANMKKAALLEEKNPLAHFGENIFADVSEKEFRRRRNGRYASRPVTKRLPMRAVDRSNIPSAIDWRTKGAVTPVKNQGECGSCYVFSAVSNIESQWFLAGHKLVNLSEQFCVSCDFNDGHCDGGDPGSVDNTLLEAYGGRIPTMESVPYANSTLVNGTPPLCRQLPRGVTGATISGIEGIEHDENVMAAWTAHHGPMSICVDSTSFQWYQSGIITNCTSIEDDHCINIVGYNFTGTVPYWIVRNSWTAEWGVDGYVYIEKGSNQCLITSDPNSVLI